MPDDTKPFYAPDRRPPKRQPKSGEKLFEFAVDHCRWLVELRDHGKHGVEAQFFQNEEFLRSMRFPKQKQAVHWAETERRMIEKHARQG
jgi:hypothetical protein